MLIQMQLTGKRRVQISEFKNNTMVSIREFYEKDGKTVSALKDGFARQVYQTYADYSSFTSSCPERK